MVGTPLVSPTMIVRIVGPQANVNYAKGIRLSWRARWMVLSRSACWFKAAAVGPRDRRRAGPWCGYRHCRVSTAESDVDRVCNGKSSGGPTRRVLQRNALATGAFMHAVLPTRQAGIYPRARITKTEILKTRNCAV